MIGNRVMSGFILLFLTLIITISMAPIPDNQLVSIKLEEQSTNETITTTEPVVYDDNSSESNETSDEQDIESTIVEYKEEIKIIPEVITNGLLVVNNTEVSVDIDEIIKITDRLFSENQAELPSTPTTESPESSQSNTDDDE
jgi:hypothetical protein